MTMERASGLRRQAGVGLIELMIAMVIGLMVVGMVTSYYLSSRQSYQTTVVSSELNNAQRYVMQLVVRQLLQAGYSDAWMTLEEVFPSFGATNDAPGFAAGQIVVGQAGGATNSSELWLRYQAAGLAGQPIIDCTNKAVDKADGVARIRLYVKDNTLLCQSSINATPQPLLNGVEALQFSYLDGSGSFQDHESADWTSVRAVRVELLVSSETDTWDAATQQSFDSQEGTLTFNDRHMRAQLSRTVTLRNIMGRQ
ncbi:MULTISPECIES: PilW family protein [Halomonas]|uniref:Pilin/secretion family protein with methylation motif n=1 Tax=Halomonas ventosae TaxID=229007 RepID=A0A4R6HQ37_9GAMM|nr:PilW family protein [Halomonas ventosae]TDO10526.1 pilin/secretion family protein with methylation motif [Halomonas ventosae]